MGRISELDLVLHRDPAFELDLQQHVRNSGQFTMQARSVSLFPWKRQKGSEWEEPHYSDLAHWVPSLAYAVLDIKILLENCSQ